MFQFLKNIFNKRTISTAQYPWMGAQRTSSGIAVNENTALNLSSVWAAINCISGELASLDCKLYREDKDGDREEATEHPIYDLLLYEPNPEMTPFVFTETQQSYLLRYGNSYSEIERDGAGRAVALWPLHPSCVFPERNKIDGKVVYRITTHANEIFLPPESVLHVPGLGDGLIGLSPIQVHRETIAHAIAIERYGSSFFGNGIRPSGIIKIASRISDQARANIKQSVSQEHAAPYNTARIMVLEEGLEFEPFSFNLEDYQFIESMRHSTEQVARIFGLSPTKIFDLGRATWNNLATLNQDFYDSCLRHWAIKWEQEIERKLLTKRERANYFVEYHFDGVLRADPLARFQIYDLAIKNGIYTVDECRLKENLNPVEPSEQPQLLQEQNGNPINEDASQPSPK